VIVTCKLMEGTTPDTGCRNSPASPGGLNGDGAAVNVPVIALSMLQEPRLRRIAHQQAADAQRSA